MDEICMRERESSSSNGRELEEEGVVDDDNEAER